MFGAPRRLDAHADAGLKAALDIAALAGTGTLLFGVGLNSGVVVAGTWAVPGGSSSA